MNVRYDNELIIDDYKNLNVRNINKLKMYIKSYSQIVLQEEEDFMVLNGDLIIICNIVEYIKNNFVVNLDNDVIDLIKQRDKNENDYNDRLSKLENINNVEIDVNTEFDEFCKEIDSYLKIKLRPYQYKSAYLFSLAYGGFDFSVPGAGKTIISYATYEFFKKHGIVDSLLIVGPINSFNAWQDEYFTCFEKQPNFCNLALADKADAKTYLNSSSTYTKEITFINIDKTWRQVKDVLQFVKDKKIMLIVDEGHKEKNPDSKITKAVLEISKYATVRTILTGTPLPNGYEDLFSLYQIYSPDRKIIPFSYSQLKNMTKNDNSQKDIKRLIEAIKPFYSRVSKKYLIAKGELKEPKYFLLPCDMTDDQKELYELLVKMSLDRYYNPDNEIDFYLMKAILIRKMQVSANPLLLSKSIVSTIEELKKEYYEDIDNDDSDSDRIIAADKSIQNELNKSNIYKIVNEYKNGRKYSSKNVMAVKKAIELISNNKKVIIWDTFVQNMENIKKIFSENKINNVEIINGKITGFERQKALDNFKNGDSMILIANPSTLAESISLHKACQNAIYVNLNFNAAQFIQSKDRIHRINMPLGTTANYYFIINNDSIDNAVIERLKAKEDRMLKVLDNDSLEIGGTEFEHTEFVSKEDVILTYRI